jgi:hypothetical protein
MARRHSVSRGARAADRRLCHQGRGRGLDHRELRPGGQVAANARRLNKFGTDLIAATPFHAGVPPRRVLREKQRELRGNAGRVLDGYSNARVGEIKDGAGASGKPAEPDIGRRADCLALGLALVSSVGNDVVFAKCGHIGPFPLTGSVLGGLQAEPRRFTRSYAVRSRQPPQFKMTHYPALGNGLP